MIETRTGAIRSSGKDGQVYSWASRIDGLNVLTKWNIYSKFSTVDNKTGLIHSTGEPLTFLTAYAGCLSQPAEHAFFSLYRESYSGFNQETWFMKTSSNTTWGDMDATYTTVVERVLYDNVDYDIRPMGLLKLSSGGVIAAFYSITLGAADEMTYYFRYRSVAGVWNNAVTATLPRLSSSETLQEFAMAQHPNGTIYFFRHLKNDTAIGLITLTEVGSPANGITMSSVSNNYIGTAATYPPYVGEPNLRISIRPNSNTALDAIVLAYQSNTSTTLGSSTGTRLALCSIARDGAKTFAQMPTKWIEASSGFEIGVDEGGQTVWVAADFLDSGGNSEGFITVANFTSSSWQTSTSANWQFTQNNTPGNVFTPPFYPITDDFGSIYGGGIRSGFAWLAAGTLNFVPFSNYQVSAPRWAIQTIGGVVARAIGRSMAIDSLGNIIIVGSFYTPGSSTMTFGSFVKTSGNGISGFIAKLSPTGTFLWVKVIGGTYDDYAEGVTVDAHDAQNNILVTGNFSPRFDFGTGTELVAVTPVYGTAGDMFLAKYDTNQNCAWAIRGGGDAGESGNCVAVDYSGNIFVLVYSSSPTPDFGSFTLTGNGSSDIVLLKVSPTGTVLWAVNYGGSDQDLPRSLAVDAVGNLWITGQFLNQTNLGNGNQSGAGAYDMFLAKYSGSNGAHLFSKVITSSAGDDVGCGIAVCPLTGRIIVTGEYSGTPTFGGSVLQMSSGNPVNSVGGVFIAAFDSSGNFLWARTPNIAAAGTGGANLNTGLGVAVDELGNIYYTGKVGNVATDFDGTFDPNQGYRSYFIASLTKDAAPRWYERATGPGFSTGWCIALRNGNVFTAGEFNSSVTLGGTTLNSPAFGSSAMFLAKYPQTP